MGKKIYNDGLTREQRYRKRHPERVITRVREWERENPKKHIEGHKRRNKKYRENHREELRKKNKEYQRERRNTPEWRERAKKEHYQLKLQVLQYYSNSLEPKCLCCEELAMEFLTLNHINGYIDKKQPRSGVYLYRWLVKNNFPSGFNVMCMNCNFALGHFGYCPHNLIKKKEVIEHQ